MSEIRAMQNMWATSLMIKISDAIYPFTINSKIPPEKQFQKFMTEDEPAFLSKNIKLDMYKAIYFLESSHFDEIVSLIGYDSEFVKRTFDYVQRCISLRKRLYTEHPSIIKKNEEQEGSDV